MKFWFRRHHYNSQIMHNLGMLTGIGGWFYPNFWHYTWFGHGDDCCDYWTPVTDPRAQRAFMLDDDLALATPHPQSNTKQEAEDE